MNSITYQFNIGIGFSDIESTGLRVIGNKCIMDPYWNVMYINSLRGSVLELSIRGFNNSTYIRDMLVRCFNMKFITDYEMEMLSCCSFSLLECENLYTSVMKEYGYQLNEDGSVIIPYRDNRDYEPFYSDVNGKLF